MKRYRATVWWTLRDDQSTRRRVVSGYEMSEAHFIGRVRRWLVVMEGGADVRFGPVSCR